MSTHLTLTPDGPMLDTDDPTLAPESAFKIRPRARQVLRPLGDRVVVLPDPPEEMIGLLHKPDIAKDRPARGTIVACGPSVSTVYPGQRVLYAHFTGAEVEHDGEEHLVLREEDIFAVAEIVEA